MILANRIPVIESLSQLASNLPPNLAASFSDQELQTIFNQLFTDHIWPQIIGRLPFEKKWDELQKMYEVQRDESRSRQKQKKETQTINAEGEDPIQLADTLIFDTVDRLKNLNYFIAWKDAPVQYNRPQYLFTQLEDAFYSPTSRKLQQANAILDWNNKMQKVRTKHTSLCQHHYLYGGSYIHADVVIDIENDPKSADFLLVKDIGTTFEPISVRKLWVNPLIPVHEMEKQSCPFFFELVPRAQILSNEYDPQFNPFGFVNLQKLAKSQYLYGPESVSFLAGIPQEARQITTQYRPEFSGEAKWTFYPYLTLSGETKTKRYIVQCYANNLFSGGILPIRIQELYYPKGRLPIFGCSHIPDLDSGFYTPSIGKILQSHYDELVRAREQFLLNKDWINNPPTEYYTGSPAANFTGINRPGAKYEVTGPNDITRRQPYDATQTTVEFIRETRDAAQTSGKAVDALLGKAMGGRTTATEASNAFQASMSGVTSDIDAFCLAIYGGYAERAWDNMWMFIPKEIRDRISGMADAPPLDDQDRMIQIGCKTDVGSTFIESIVKQQHYQQAIASATMSPCLDQAKLWKALFEELKMPKALLAVNDNGLEFQIAFSTTQAIDTYYGKPIAIDPSQDHQVAIKVKTRFLQDTASVFNEQMAGNPSPVAGLTVTQYLAQQIQIHQQFVMLQMQQQVMLQQAQLHDENQIQQHEQQLKGAQIAAKSKPANPNPSPSQGVPQ